MKADFDSEVCVVLLAGGHSSRFGSDKSRVKVDGRRSIDRIVAACAGLGPLLVVGGQPRLVEGEHRWVQDRYPGEGPLQALVSAVKYLSGRGCLVLPCDLPLITARHLELLCGELPEGFDARIPRLNGRAQFLAAFYGPSSLSRLDSCWEKGGRSMRDFVETLSVHWVDEAVFRAENLDTGAFTDFDTPSDLEEIEGLKIN